jgi:hypothetical protein
MPDNQDLLLAGVGILGFILAVLFIQNNNLQTELASLMVVEGILIPLIPTFFSALSQLLANLFKKKLAEYILQIEALFISSLLSLFVASLVGNLISTNAHFNLLTPAFLESPESLYLILISVGLALLFVALVLFLIIIQRLLRYLRSDSLNIVEENMKQALTNLPLQITENYPEASQLEPLLTTSIHWWDDGILDSNIRGGLNIELLPQDSKPVADDIIKKFVKELSELAPKLIKEYIALYKLLNAESEGDKRIIAAAINSIRGYDHGFWPNINTAFEKDDKLRGHFEKVMKSIETRNEVREFKKSIEHYGEIDEYVVQINALIGKL